MKRFFLLSVLLLTVFLSQALSLRHFSKSADNPKIVSQILYPPIGLIENLSLYPNPVVDELKISFKSSKESKATILILNTIGKQVLVQDLIIEAGNNQFTIDITNNSMEPGIYFFQLIITDETFTRKLIVK